MESIVYRPCTAVRQVLSDYLAEKEREVMSLLPPQGTFEFWEEAERRVHISLLATYIVEDPNIHFAQYNQLQKKLLAKRPARGRPREFRPGWTNPTYRRSLQHWLLDKAVAAGLGVPFKEPAPPIPEGDLRLPVETIEMLQNFERLTEYKLPRKAYVSYTREDRVSIRAAFLERLATPDWEEEGKLCVRFEEYVALRQSPTNRRLIEQVLTQLAVKHKKVHAHANQPLLEAVPNSAVAA